MALMPWIGIVVVTEWTLGDTMEAWAVREGGQYVGFEVVIGSTFQGDALDLSGVATWDEKRTERLD
eukprot:940597-Amorphochlora_amoeboformis.AAC.2